MSPDQPSSQPTLGEFLRQERERRGITIEQVASATKIGVKLLHLLESDQYVELPAKPFIRGFVMSYCKFIGVDSKEVLTRYGDFLEVKSHDRPSHDEGHSGYAFEKRDGEQSRTALSLVMGGFILLGAIAIFVLKPSLHRHKSSHADALREANTEVSPTPTSSPSLPSLEVLPSPSATPSLQASSIPTSTPSPSVTPSPSLTPTPSVTPIVSPKPVPLPSPKAVVVPSPVPSASPAPGEKPDLLNSGVNLKPSEILYKVVIKTSADVWVRYQLDDRPKMKFILRMGRSLVLRAHASVRFQSSAPEAISFRINSGANRSMENDSNTALRGKDLTLLFPKELIETVQDPFPGEKPLMGASVPAPWRASH